MSTNKSNSKNIYNYWEKKFFSNSDFFFSDYQRIKKYFVSGEEKFIFRVEELIVHYYLVSYLTNFSIDIKKDLILNQYKINNKLLIENINIIYMNHPILNSIDLSKNKVFSYFLQRVILDSILNDIDLKDEYSKFFIDYEEFLSKNYLRILRRKISDKYNLLNVHIFMERLFLQLVSSYKLDKLNVFYNIYTHINIQIKKNIFLERYQYRLNLITNYIVFSYYKENKINKLNSQININDLLLNLKFREIYSEKDIEILKNYHLI